MFSARNHGSSETTIRFAILFFFPQIPANQDIIKNFLKEKVGQLVVFLSPLVKLGQ